MFFKTPSFLPFGGLLKWPPDDPIGKREASVESK